VKALREFVNGLDRAELQAHLERRGFAVYDHEDADTLREALYQDLELEGFPRRCPHDGGYCHHDCDVGECFREAGGMSLSTPHPGYPLPGHGTHPPSASGPERGD